MLSRIRLFAGILVVAVASAYVSDPLLLTRPAYLRHGLALQSSDDSFQDRWNPNHESETNGYSHRQTPMDSSSSLTAQNVAQFCSKVGCTIQDYQWTVERLKRRKVELSKQMLAAEDELEFEKKQKLQTSQRNSGISVLKERRKKLSDRALAIQNLLATLRALEETAPMGASPPQATGARAPKKGTKEIVERYREILEAERMQKFEVTKASKPTGSKMHHKALHTQRKDVSFSEYWNSLWTPRRQPQPPHLPPTVKQFMVRDLENCSAFLDSLGC